MNGLLPKDLEALLEDRPGPCVSLYFSTSPPGSRTPQGPIRLKRLLGVIETELRARETGDAATAAILGPLKDLLADGAFWSSGKEGVALFLSPSFLRAWHLASAFPERWSVGERFFLKPLLPLLESGDAFYVLALSQNEVRLLEAGGGTLRRLTGQDLPEDLEAALGSQKEPEYLLYHTASSAPAGARPAVYHGQGVSAGDEKDELRRFLRRVDAAVRKLLSGHTAPLVLAGADPLPALYREINGYPHLVMEAIAGNPEHLSDEELRDRARRILEPTFLEARRQDAEHFGELAGTRRASTDVTEILPAARDGRVEALFLACDADVWGRLDPQENVVVHAAPEPGDEDLLDAAALLSLRQGGAVYGLGRGEVPGGGDLAAVFRY